MRKFLRYWLISILSLLAVTQLGHAFRFATGYSSLIEAAFFLTVFEYFLKPLVKLLFLPVNIITLGSLRWLIDVFALFLATTFVPSFQVKTFAFAGFQGDGFVIPSFAFHGFWAYVVAAFSLNLIIGLFRWLF